MVEFVVSGEGDASEYFHVHPTDGDVTLLKSVLDTQRQLYKVQMHVK